MESLLSISSGWMNYKSSNSSKIVVVRALITDSYMSLLCFSKSSSKGCRYKFLYLPMIFFALWSLRKFFNHFIEKFEFWVAVLIDDACFVDDVVGEFCDLHFILIEYSTGVCFQWLIIFAWCEMKCVVFV